MHCWTAVATVWHPLSVFWDWNEDNHHFGPDLSSTIMALPDGPVIAGSDVVAYCHRSTSALVEGMRSRVGANYQNNRWVIATGQGAVTHKFLTKDEALIANEHVLAGALLSAAESETDPRLTYWLQSLAAATRRDAPMPVPTTMTNRSTRRANPAMRHTVPLGNQTTGKDLVTGRSISAVTRLTDEGRKNLGLI